MRIIQCSSGEQQHRRRLDATVLEQKHGGVPQSRPCRRSERSGSAVTRCVARQVPNCTPDHEFRTCKQSVLSEERLTSYMRIIQCSFSERRMVQMSGCTIGAGRAHRRGPALQTLRSRSEVQSPDVLHARGPQPHARSRVQNFQAECLVIERLTSYGSSSVASGEQQQ
jgi:hypothetical protein